MTIHYSDRLNFTPALTLALRGSLELLESGLYPHRITIYGQENVIWIGGINRSDPARGCIVFDVDGEDVFKRLWVLLSYVDPTFRRRGIFKQMWEALEVRARELGVRRISGGVAIENGAMQAAALSVGRIGKFIEFQKEIET